MRPRRFWDFCYYSAKFLQVLFGFLGALIPLTEKIPLEKVASYWASLGVLTKWMQDNSWWASPSSLLIAGIATLLMKWVGEPWAWQVVSSLIDGLRNEIFKNKTDPVHFHRVTLFKCKRWCFTRKHGRILLRKPWIGWLRAVIRSGHTTLKSRPTFATPDSGNAEGIAGKAWSAKAMIREVNLPEVNLSTGLQNLAKYAERTGINIEELRLLISTGKEFACSFCAFPVEKDDGAIWGVIVIDSRDPGLPSKTKIGALFVPMAKCLTKLVTRL